MKKIPHSLVSICILLFLSCESATPTQNQEETPPPPKRVSSGAENLISQHLDELQGKKVALVGNHTTRVASTHLVDTLLALGVELVQVYAPEHGFRGEAGAGEKIENGTDPQTGLPVLSLYGQQRKPQAQQLADIDLMLFDIQDVGTRHYTYISTMTEVMEACAENNVPIWVLDRPNPNGWLVDGPMMQSPYRSFIGKHEVPIAHGMTIGEYASMVNGEGWLEGGRKASLRVIPCGNYDHSQSWEETGMTWVAPSPNIPSPQAAYLYPALCWLEPTPVSIGRGTHEAFTMAGAPWFDPSPLLQTATARTDAATLAIEAYSFTPVSLPGKAVDPKYEDQMCQGVKFSGRTDGKTLFITGIKVLQTFYQQSEPYIEEDFFKKGFERWSGTPAFKAQVMEGESPEEIWASWQPGVDLFKAIRRKYLLYPDFES